MWHTPFREDEKGEHPDRAGHAGKMLRQSETPFKAKQFLAVTLRAKYCVETPF